MTRKMKDSGIEWIGEIPEDWEISKLKYGFYFQKGINSNKYTKEYIDLNKGNYPVYSGQTENDGIMGTINSYDYNINECLFTTTVGAKVMDVRLIGGKFNLSQNCLIMESKEVHFTSYMYYFLQPLFDYERFMIPQYMQPSLRIADLENYTIVAPSFDKQVKISIFLDDKIKTIQNIKDTINQEIQTLEDYKKSIITEAVTKGLDKNVEMKDSGIEWIGEIPKHWNVIPLKHICKITMGQSVNGSDILDEKKGYPFLQGCAEFTEYIPSPRYWSTKANKIIDRGSLLMSVRAPVGDVNIADQTYGIGRGLCAFNGINNKYIYYILISSNSGFLFYSNGTTYDAITVETLKNFKVAYSSINEQDEIVAYLDKKCTLVDSAISKKQKQLEVLEEYKKSLIYEYVTGKKEVKDGEES